MEIDKITEAAPRFPVGVSDFRDLVTGDYRFVDKTNFIKEVMEDGAKVLLITRPRRFGKTLNMSMLSYFLRLGALEDRQLFDDLAISSHEGFYQRHQQQYPVIFVSFKGVKEGAYADAYAKMVALIKDLYAEHIYLLDDGTLYAHEKKEFEAILGKSADTEQVQSAIKKLSSYLMRKFEKPAIILIDEYDTPIQEAYLKNYYNEMVVLMRGVLGDALKDNQFMHKGVLTGITRVSQESLFSGLNNLAVYSLLQKKYAEYFGFTEAEVIKLSHGIKLQSGLESIKAWYNGYHIGAHMIYNPWSIIQCLANDGELKPYWLNTSSNALIQELFAKADATAIRGHFYELLQGQTIEKQLMENLVFSDLDVREDAIWSLLLYAGYLNVFSAEMRQFQLIAKIAVPNMEVMFVYDEMVAGWFRRRASLADYEHFIRSLASGDMETFKRCLADYLMESGSYFDFHAHTPEQVFQVFMLGLVVGLKSDYVIQANRESGLGRLDVVFEPKDKNKNLLGIVLEFKTTDDAERLALKANEALDQIKDKKYTSSLKQNGIKEILIVGLAFCGKQVDLASERIRVE